MLEDSRGKRRDRGCGHDIGVGLSDTSESERDRATDGPAATRSVAVPGIEWGVPLSWLPSSNVTRIWQMSASWAMSRPRCKRRWQCLMYVIGTKDFVHQSRRVTHVYMQDVEHYHMHFQLLSRSITRSQICSAQRTSIYERLCPVIAML